MNSESMLRMTYSRVLGASTDEVHAKVVEEPVHVGPAEIEEQRSKQGRRCDELTEDPDEPGEARERRRRWRRLSRLV